LISCVAIASRQKRKVPCAQKRETDHTAEQQGTRKALLLLLAPERMVPYPVSDRLHDPQDKNHNEDQHDHPADD
jgi:hypothetical protein